MWSFAPRIAWSAALKKGLSSSGPSSSFLRLDCSQPSIFSNFFRSLNTGKETRENWAPAQNERCLKTERLGVFIEPTFSKGDFILKLEGRVINIVQYWSTLCSHFSMVSVSGCSRDKAILNKGICTQCLLNWRSRLEVMTRLLHQMHRANALFCGRDYDHGQNC